MQCHCLKTHALLAQLQEQFGREVQSGSRCGCTAFGSTVDSLIAFAIAAVFGDIGRQRHFAQLVEIGLDRLGELDDVCAGIVDDKDGGRDRGWGDGGGEMGRNSKSLNLLTG